ncbi:MAG: thermopsin family protease, partial [Euryarchaeota archaeon]|nr:thermopsin family protease [Euryarchaeota archaeon]
MGNTATAAKSRLNLTAWARNVAPFLAISVMMLMLVSGLGLISAVSGAVPLGHAGIPTSHAAAKSTSSAAAPAKASGSSSNFAPNMAQRAALEQNWAASSKAAHVPSTAYLPPDLLSNRVTAHPGQALSVNPPNDTYPVGIGDVGVTSLGYPPRTASLFNTASWEGTMTINSGSAFMINNDGPDFFGAQLNTVLENVTVGGSAQNSFWTQDVFDYSTV